jgi:SAM-dependent methyltransferase
VARRNPHSQLTGVDRCHARLDDARAHAARERLANVAFEHVDVLAQPLPFPDQRFDLVNAHFLASFLSGYADWRPLLRECARLLRPGGILRLVECVEGQTNSVACQTLYVAYQQALLRAGLCPVLFGPSPQELIFWLDGLLHDAGCQQVERQVRRLTWKTASGRGAELSGYLLLTLRQVQPFLLEQGVISRGEFERAYRDVSEEIRAGRFAASWQLYISTGTRTPYSFVPFCQNTP